MRRVSAYIIVSLFGLQLMTSCASTAPSDSKKTQSYQEDLTQVRPHYSYKEPVLKPLSETTVQDKSSTPKAVASVSRPVNKEVDAVLDTLAKQNKLIRYISGFRIQIYSGNIRSQAEGAKTFIYQNFPNLIPYVSYTQPTYRVKVGDFMYRSDAEAYLGQLKDQYGSAVILADKIEIKKGLASRHTEN